MLICVKSGLEIFDYFKVSGFSKYGDKIVNINKFDYLIILENHGKPSTKNPIELKELKKILKIN